MDVIPKERWVVCHIVRRAKDAMATRETFDRNGPISPKRSRQHTPKQPSMKEATKTSMRKNLDLRDFIFRLRGHKPRFCSLRISRRH
ncbi:hypothetical protein K438DRAFT_971422 [Mycena galopus ATCC 62051]|nr:hypothetical protein K438DRAFT_971422 [Mycena galopus ATCC 62051]